MEFTASKLKENIFNTIDQSINEIIQFHNSHLNQLKSENEKLQLELTIQQKKLEHQDKIIEELELKNMELQLKIIELNNEINEKPNEMNIEPDHNIRKYRNINPIEILNKLLLEERYEECGIVAKKFAQKVSPNEFSLESHRKLGEFLQSVFLIEPIDIKNMVSLYSACLSIMMVFSCKKEVILQFITKNEKLVNKRILDSMDAKLMDELAEFYLKNNHEYKLKAYINSTLNDSNIIYSSDEHISLIRLLWYGFYMDKEKLLSTISWVEALSREFDHLAEVEIYSLYCKIINGTLSYEEGAKLISNIKNNLFLLNKEVEPRFIRRLNDKLGHIAKEKIRNSDAVVRKKDKTLRKLTFVTKLPPNNSALKNLEKHFYKELVQLAIYNDPSLKVQSGFTTAEILISKESGKAYILDKEIMSLRKKLIRKWTDIRLPNKSSALDGDSFAWPSTELTGTNTHEEKTTLNEESELKKLGYQITGIPREKRWPILEIAVKQLGLRKVVYTIAQNIKLRKGQKNGMNKFSFSIGEWEHDLNKLKQKYYKNDFPWPLQK